MFLALTVRICILSHTQKFHPEPRRYSFCLNYRFMIHKSEIRKKELCSPNLGDANSVHFVVRANISTFRCKKKSLQMMLLQYDPRRGTILPGKKFEMLFEYMPTAARLASLTLCRSKSLLWAHGSQERGLYTFRLNKLFLFYYKLGNRSASLFIRFCRMKIDIPFIQQ